MVMMMMTTPPAIRAFVLLLLVFLSGAVGVAVAARRRGGGGKPPIVEEATRRKLNRQTHCQFGNLTYELEERWRPDLGPPFGVLYCVRCECTPVHRKKRVVARVRCENIKNDCPKPTCDDPVLLPERCCKTCPGEDYADLEEGLALRKLELDDEDRNSKEFSALLTGRGSYPTVATTVAAVGYLTYIKKDLHIGVYHNSPTPVTSILITNEEGYIVQEHEVANKNTLSADNSTQVCAVWNKIPKVYRRLLQKEKLHMALVTNGHPNGLVAGRIVQSTRLEPEVFSSLMVPDPAVKETLGGGGVAAISPSRTDIHVTVMFNGIFAPTDARDVVVKLSLLAGKTSESAVVASSEITLPKIHVSLNTASVKLTLPPEQQPLMVAGKLSMRLTSPDGRRHIEGPVIVRPTCNIFQAVLTAETSNSGFAVLNVNQDGSISYQAYASGMNSAPMVVVLETDSPADNEVRTMAASYNPPFAYHWTNGTFTRGTSQVLEMLLTDDLTFKVLSEGQSELRGRVKQRLYSDAFLSAEAPVLLMSEGNSSAAGQAWLSVDKSCRLHYSVFVSGLEPSERHLLELLEITPAFNMMPSARSVQRVLQRITGDELEDTLDEPSAATLHRLSGGSSYLLVTSKSGKSKQVELRGHIRDIRIPDNCLPDLAKSGVSGGSGHTAVAGYSSDAGGAENNEIYRIESNHKCYYDGEVFDDGAQWTARHEACVMCSCQRGRLVCDAVVCPAVQCPNAVTLPGECCPTCQDESGGLNATFAPGEAHSPHGCFLEGDKKFHLAGSKWHPYIPPFGFSRCAVCTCQPTTLTVECRRITCPPLSCSEKDAYRENALSCCKKCPNVIPVKSQDTSVPTQLRDQGSKKTPKDILSSGGCQFQLQVFHNGEEWHPTVQPFGEMKCIRCHCKDGKSRCRRQRCAKLSCPIKFQKEDECCPRCADNGEGRAGDRPPRRTGRKRKTRGGTPWN
ncbi:dorsal-ventral patterning protein Sog-like isoform X2 [Dermacentor variabilis]|uniref:dorsal-ventral patterning protein Sog-like isoform X2 n=1 Tax=Dermacentor variabilis TaxID=34621 RepID=UPI003F5BE405